MSAPAGVSPHPDAIRAILALVQPGLARVERSLAALAESDDPVLGPMLSSVLPGSGKRLRPALALLIGRMAAAVDHADGLNHMAVGVELLHTASLVHDDQLDEALQVITSLWREPSATFAGRHYQITDARCDPRPSVPPTLMVGGKGPRTLRLAARYADWWNAVVAEV